MAKYKSRKKKSKYTETEKMAFQLGRVEKGLKNPNSKVSESFMNGQKSVEKKKRPKKSLF